MVYVSGIPVSAEAFKRDMQEAAEAVERFAAAREGITYPDDDEDDEEEDDDF